MIDSKYYSELIINKTASDLDSGYIFVPWTFSEHSEESLKGYNDFMKQYHLKHKYCPLCGSEKYSKTLMGYPLYNDKKEEYKDLNRCTCSDCGNRHVYHDRVGKASVTEQMCYILSHSPAPKPIPENIVEEVERNYKELIDMINTEFKINKKL